MKSKLKSFKTIALLLSLVVLIHGCVAYGKVDYNTAAVSGKRVKLKMHDKKIYKFNKISIEGDDLILLKDKPVAKRYIELIKTDNANIDFENDQIVRYKININQVLELKQYDTTLSVLVTIFVGIPFAMIPLAPIFYWLGVI